MSGLFRSETMVYARMLLPDESAYDTLKQIGQFGKAHMVDLSLRQSSSAPTDRIQQFKKRVAAAGFWERKLLNFHSLFAQYDVEAPSIDCEPVALGGGDIIEAVRAFLEPLESTLTKDVLYAREQRQMLATIRERQEVLRVVDGRVVGGRGAESRTAPAYGSFDNLEEESALLGDEEKAQRVPDRAYFSNSIHGVLDEDRVALFERMVFRISRGNVVTRCTPIPGRMLDPADPKGPGLRKSVFSMTFVGEALASRLRKVIVHFGGVEYEVPGSERARSALGVQLQKSLLDARNMLRATETSVASTLRSLAWDAASSSSPYVNTLYSLRIEKGICDALKKSSMEDEDSSVVVVECWLPRENYEELQEQVRVAVQQSGAQAGVVEIVPNESVARWTTPPTYFKTNKFTAPYQAIVDTYGVPRYKEVNPGLFTIISFPFLFGVMYGDIGHGTLLTLGALYFILRERYYLDLVRRGEMEEIMGMVFGGRYLLVAMGIFAVYAGWIYNDCFAVPINAFGSRWTVSKEVGVDSEHHGVYPFGVDPSWYHTTNELAFFNSLKMKLAVTLGVTQMTFGIVLGCFNNLYFGEVMSVFLEFLPRLTFMMCTFGYMIFLILYKFSVDWKQSAVGPPNLVQTMIAMFLSPGTVEADKQLYPGQAGVQMTLLFLALVSVPIMLLAQPLLARAEHNRLFPNQSSPSAVKSTSTYQRVAESKHHDEDLEQLDAPVEVVHEEEPDTSHGANPRSKHYNFADHAITQGIHTIEFVLGAVSNTASYLRLWALSLAHAELSAVFWDKMIAQVGLNGDSAFLMVVGMAAWAGATFAVLLAMDVLECFLHALRLHWVEFQNKFFHADGVAYKPFSFSDDSLVAE